MVPSECRVQVIRNSREHSWNVFWVTWGYSISYVIKLINQVSFKEVRLPVAMSEGCVNVVGYAAPSSRYIVNVMDRICVIVILVVFVSLEEVRTPVVSPQEHFINILWYSSPESGGLGVVWLGTSLDVIEAPVLVILECVGLTVSHPWLDCIKTGLAQTWLTKKSKSYIWWYVKCAHSI